MGRLTRLAQSLPEAMLPNRKPPPSLLRLKPRPARRVLAAFLLVSAGGLAGLLLGMGLQSNPAARSPAVSQPAELATTQRGDPRATSAADPAPAATESLREAQAAEESRLATAIQARVVAESRLAELNRALAAATAQRDALRGAGPRDSEPRGPGPREFGPRDFGPRDAVPPNPRDLASRDPGPTPREPFLRREAVPPPVTALAPGPAPLRPPRADVSVGNASASRVVVHYRTGSATASEAAATAGQLREAGFEAGELRSVATVPAQRIVRYFHTEDAPAAARVAGRLGRGWAIQDFRAFEPSPAAGLLEVWLPDR